MVVELKLPPWTVRISTMPVKSDATGINWHNVRFIGNGTAFWVGWDGRRFGNSTGLDRLRREQPKVIDTVWETLVMLDFPR
jgi:hypothetical protein